MAINANVEEPSTKLTRNLVAREMWNKRLNFAMRLALFRGMRFAGLFEEKWDHPEASADIEQLDFDELDPSLQIVLVRELRSCVEPGKFYYPRNLYFICLEIPPKLKKKKEAS